MSQTTAASAEPSLQARAHDTSFFGHPRGLMTLFFTEMWERFSYYGMRAILTLFMTTGVAAGGLGMRPEESGPIYAMYTSLVYLASVPGGWLADNFLGQRRSVLYGGIVIMMGHICLAMHGLTFFYTGLGCIIFGTGLLKPNISVIVGQLYDQKDDRRDSGFSIFYMGINVGAFMAPMVCGFLAQHAWFKGVLVGIGMDPRNSWHWGFGAAAVGMFLGLVQYLSTGHYMGEAGMHPAVPKNEAAAGRNKRLLVLGIASLAAVALSIAWLAASLPELMSSSNINGVYTVLLILTVLAFFARIFLAGEWTGAERARLVLIFVLFCGAAVFWGVFEQAGTTLTLFAERSTDNRLLGFEFPSSWWQFVNAGLIVLLAPVFSWLWVALRGHNPSYPTKFGIGLLFAGIGFLWLVGGALQLEDQAKVGIHWLFGVYLFHTIGELFLSPVGLSSMTKLAPQRVVGQMMGVWFLAASVGNFLGGSVSGFYEKLDLPALFSMVAVSAFVMAGIMFALVIPIRNMMARAG